MGETALSSLPYVIESINCTRDLDASFLCAILKNWNGQSYYNPVLSIVDQHDLSEVH